LTALPLEANRLVCGTPLLAADYVGQDMYTSRERLGPYCSYLYVCTTHALLFREIVCVYQRNLIEIVRVDFQKNIILFFEEINTFTFTGPDIWFLNAKYEQNLVPNPGDRQGYIYILSLARGCVTYKTVFGWMIGFIDTLITQLGTIGNTALSPICTLYSSLLHTN
jgi:hypothetical protein